MRLIVRILKWAAILFFASTFAAVLIYRFVPVQVTPLMMIRAINPQGTVKQQERERHWRHQWVPVDRISRWMPAAVVASEDGHFYSHHGFDFEAIEKAVEERRSGKRKRGASTISQQTAKNVFLWPGRSWLRKGLETYFTILIEIAWPKERIMEVYLNSIEMGAGVYGIEAAAAFYFNTTADKLTKRQCALIAVSLPSPLRMDPARPSAYVQKRARQIMRYM